MKWIDKMDSLMQRLWINIKFRGPTLSSCARGYGALCLVLFSGLTLADQSQAETKPVCRYVKYASLPINFSHFRPTIEGTVNGSAVTMLIDTGADGTALTRGTVEKLGLSPMHSDVSHFGMSGESENFVARVKEISFGPVHWKAVNLDIVWDIESQQAAGPQRAGVIIGADFLFHGDIEIFLAEQKFNFFEPTGCKEAFLAYWDKNASMVELESLSDQDHRRTVTVEVNGQKIRALIDTGATTSVINLATAARLGVTPQSPGVVEINVTGIGKHHVSTWVAPFDSFTIGDETIKKSRIAIRDFWGASLSDSNNMGTAELVRDQPEMIIGTDFLKAHRVLFALSQRRFYFSYLGGSVFYE